MSTEGTERPRSEAIPSLLRGRELVQEKDWLGAGQVLSGAGEEYVWAHDGMRNLNVRIQDAAYERFGRDAGDRLADAVYQRMTDWAFAATDTPAFRDQVTTFAMLWQRHRTPVRIVEDAEKVSYIMQPCGSGGRLVNEGAYLPTARRPLSVLEEASFASFSERNFPSWCTHCAFSNRGYLRRSMPYFLLEGWSDHRRWGGCAAHSYKDMAFVPREAFERVGLEAPELTAGPVEPRSFSDEELAELARPVEERILEAVARRDAAAALDLIERSWRAWMNLHDAYRCWYAMWVALLTEQGGVALVDQLVDASAWELVAPVVEAADSGEERWLQFWSNHTGAVVLEASAHGRRLSVSREALVHAELEPSAAEELAERLARAVMAGVERAGRQADFGRLRYREGVFEHTLPGGERAPVGP